MQSMRFIFVLMLSLPVCLASCRSDRRPGADGSSPSNVGPLSAGETAERIRSLRHDGRYRELRNYIVPEHAAIVIDFLMAMDDVIAANESVQLAIRKNAPASQAKNWDLGAMRYLQGVFSDDVKVIDEKVEDPRAIVTIEVGGQLPLEHAEFRKIGERWLFCPDSDFAGFPESLRKLAISLRRVARAIDAGSRDDDAIQTEYHLRVSPQVQRVQALAAAQIKD